MDAEVDHTTLPVGDVGLVGEVEDTLSRGLELDDGDLGVDGRILEQED